MVRPSLRTFLGIAGSAIIGAVALTLLDWTALRQAFVRLDLNSLLAAGALSSLSVAAAGARWAYLLAPPGGRPEMANCRRALVANVFNLFTPAALGADVYRFVTADDRTRAAGLLVIERVFGLASFGWWFLAGYFVLRARGPVSTVFAAAAITFALIAVSPVVLIPAMRLSKRLLRRGDRLIFLGWLSQVTAASDTPVKNLLITAIFSALASGCWLAAIATISNSVGLSIPPAGIAVSAAITEVSRILPISIQGIGVREATFAWLATQLGGQAAPAFIACGIAYALQFSLVVTFAGVARFVFSAPARNQSITHETV